MLERLDRVVNSESSRQEKTEEEHWVAEVARVREHLSMVFHRFLSDSSSSGVKIWLNGEAVESWDPFCSKHTATQSLPADSNSDLGALVTVTGYVLPHRDRFDLKDPGRSAKLHKEAGGPSGWNAQQGFYLYRNRRLIIPGTGSTGPGQNGWKKDTTNWQTSLIFLIPWIRSGRSMSKSRRRLLLLLSEGGWPASQ